MAITTLPPSPSGEISHLEVREKINEVITVQNNNVGYGTIANSPITAISDITSTPQILPASSGVLSSPKKVTQDFANNALVLNQQGVWQLSAAFELSFTGSTSARAFEADVYNNTDAISLGGLNVAVGRNQEGAGGNRTFLLELPASFVGDQLVLRIFSTTDTFTGVNLLNYSFGGVLIEAL